MKKEKGKNILIGILIVIIIVLIVFIILFTTNIISFNKKVLSDTQTQENNTQSSNNESTISTQDISEEKLKSIIEKQLFILFKYNYDPNTKYEPIAQKEDIDNNSKLFLALNMLEEEYTTKSNDINTIIVNFSTSKLEDAFNSSVISDLGIKHESFDIYELTNDIAYNKKALILYSKGIYQYRLPHASKVKSYEKSSNQYIISMNYLFPDDDFEWQYYYGSLNDVKNGENSVVKAYNDNGTSLNAQEYLDNNYNDIKDKLATYNYTFEIRNNKINLVNFSIN